MGRQWASSDHMQIICILLQTDNHASTSPLSFFYGLDALPASQQHQSTEGSNRLCNIVEIDNTNEWHSINEIYGIHLYHCTNFLNASRISMQLDATHSQTFQHRLCHWWLDWEVDLSLQSISPWCIIPSFVLIKILSIIFVFGWKCMDIFVFMAALDVCHTFIHGVALVHI